MDTTLYNYVHLGVQFLFDLLFKTNEVKEISAVIHLNE
jgi:hypothetical protein